MRLYVCDICVCVSILIKVETVLKVVGTMKHKSNGILMPWSHRKRRHYLQKRKGTSKFWTKEMEKNNIGERIFRTEWWLTSNGNVCKIHLFIVTLQYFTKCFQMDFIMWPYDNKIKALLKSKKRTLKNIQKF